MFSAHSFGITEPEYPTQADKNLLVIVQIESRQGVENVEAIAAVEGIDVLFVGKLDSHHLVIRSLLLVAQLGCRFFQRLVLPLTSRSVRFEQVYECPIWRGGT